MGVAVCMEKKGGIFGVQFVSSVSGSVAPKGGGWGAIVPS